MASLPLVFPYRWHKHVGFDKFKLVLRVLRQVWDGIGAEFDKEFLAGNKLTQKVTH
jgi:hypothetical protein